MTAPELAGGQDGLETARVPILQRVGGVTKALVGGVALEVSHGDLSGGGATGSDDGAKGASTDDDAGEDAALEMWTWFFEEGFTLAAATGFAKVWPGGSYLVQALADPDSRVRSIIAATTRGDRPQVLELGAGCGLVGLSAAAALGGDVVLTDVLPVVDGVLARNLQANGGAARSGAACGAAREPRQGAVAIGTGTAAAAVLDWTLPAEAQLGEGSTEAPDVFIAAECVWLSELVEPFAETAASLLHLSQRRRTADPVCGTEDSASSGPRPVLILASRERSREGSSTFASVSAALAALAAKGCGDCELVDRVEPSGPGAVACDDDEDGPLLVYAVRPDPVP